MRGIVTFLFCLACLVVFPGCTRLGAFDSLIPKDAGTRRVASGLAYGADDRQVLDVYAPQGAAAGRPVIVFFYGGSWNSGRRQDYEFAARAFAGRGYVVVVPDYRLVPEIRYPAFVEDSARAVAWTSRNAKRFGGDPGRIALVGHSAGAYNAMMVALAPEFLRAQGVPARTVRAVVGISGPYDFLPLDVDETREAFAGVADLERTQPVNRAADAGAVPPVLLVHGKADDFVYLRNSQALARRLRAAGHPVEERYYDGIGHVGTLLALSRPMRSRAPVLDDVAGFLDARFGADVAAQRRAP